MLPGENVEDKIYAAIGDDGFTRLVAAFYRRVPTDGILGPMYPPHDLPAAEQRLRDFLIQRFGGPSTYSIQRGHPRLRMRHAPFTIDAAAAVRWMELMNEAMNETALPVEIQTVLRDYFRSTAIFMINRVAFHFS